jgi:hypothetical protein
MTSILAAAIIAFGHKMTSANLAAAACLSLFWAHNGLGPEHPCQSLTSDMYSSALLRGARAVTLMRLAEQRENCLKFA